MKIHDEFLLYMIYRDISTLKVSNLHVKMIT